MAINAKGIAGTAIGVASLGLVGHAYGMVPKKMGHGVNNQKQTKNMVCGAVGLIVGTGLLGAAAKAQQAM